MNVRDIMAFINTLEHKYPVDKWEINTIHIWPLIRFQIYFYLYEKHTFTNDVVTKRVRESFSRKFKLLSNLFLLQLKSVITCITKPSDFHFSIKKSDIVLFDDTSYSFYNKKYYNRFTDPVIEDMNKRGKSSFLISLTSDYAVPRHAPAKFIKPYLRLKILFKSFFKKVGFNNVVLPQFDSFYDEVLAFDKDLKIINRTAVINHGFSICIIRDYVLNLFKKINPKAVFQVSYYNVYGMAISNAAHALGLPCVELQHGTQNDFHVGYGLWKKVPHNGFNSLPSIFAVWDVPAANTINGWASHEIESYHKPFLYGNRFLDKFKGANAAETIFYQYYEKINDSVKPSKHILLSLQFMFGLPNLFEKMLKGAPSEYFWWIRLHPAMLDEKKGILATLQNLGIENFEIEESTCQPLYSVLPHMDVNVTLNSSVVHEALQFGVRSIVCDETAKEYYAEYIDKKDFILATNSEAILAALVSIEKLQVPNDAIRPENLYELLGL